MDKEIIKKIIVEYQNFSTNVDFISRSITIEKSTNYVFTGLRRAGKSYTLYQIIHEKIKQGYTFEQILYINFEDERFIGFQAKDFNLIIESYNELYDTKPLFFLDEIQVVEGWQKFVRRLADTKYTVFVTGSNAEMLSSEIASTLGGRFVIMEIFPYNFKDFIIANKVKLKKNWEYNSVKSKIVRLADNYLHYGGLPEIVNRTNKRDWISALYQKIYFGDLIVRYNIRKDMAIKLMIKKLAESITQAISYNRLSNIVSSIGTKISTTTISEYIKYALNSWLLFSISNYTSDLKSKETIKKYYFTDNGILNLFLFEDKGVLLENIIAIDLFKKYGNSLYFYKKNIEVDFFIYSTKTAIQVSYSIDKVDTLERETKAIKKLNSYIPLQRAVIITYNSEQLIELKDLTIELIPYWKWLL